MAESKIGIMGGTFDPIHLAHVQLAKSAYAQFHLDSVIFLPSGDPPHKADRTITPAYRRLEMVKMSIRDIPYFDFSEYEIDKQGYSYTAETLEYFTQIRPEDQLYFIIGADSLFQLEHWYCPEKCLSKAIFLVGNRDAHTEEEIDQQIKHMMERFGGLIQKIDMPPMEISSSRIRQLLDSDQDVSRYLDPRVNEYILENHLYRKNPIENLTMTVKKCLPAGRFLHTLGVAEVAQNMAIRYGVDVERAKVAALLHDIAKPLSVEEMVALCKDTEDPITEDELLSPKVLHAKAGAVLARTQFHVEDKGILTAIRNHTTGAPNMSVLEKIIFVADFIEPGRSKAPNLDKIRKESTLDLNRTVFMIIRDTLDYLRANGEHIDERSEETYQYYKSITGMN